MRSAFIHEGNWENIVTHIDNYPIRISEISKIQKAMPLQQLSFKYNLLGNESYCTNRENVQIKSGEYLFAINETLCEVKINELSTADLGLCIDLDTAMMCTAIQEYTLPNVLDPILMTTPYFLQDNYFLKFKASPAFRSSLERLFKNIKQSELYTPADINHEFLNLLITDQMDFLLAYQQLPVIKKSTQTELFKKMVLARSILHDSIYSDISITELAKMIYLSEYRFYHMFKSAYKVSPYQYLLHLRLNEAARLKALNQFSWTEIATLLNFPDLQSFSKAFKKYHKVSPKYFCT